MPWLWSILKQSLRIDMDIGVQMVMPNVRMSLIVIGIGAYQGLAVHCCRKPEPRGSLGSRPVPGLC
jgi:hypothetical protein